MKNNSARPRGARRRGKPGRSGRTAGERPGSLSVRRQTREKNVWNRQHSKKTEPKISKSPIRACFTVVKQFLHNSRKPHSRKPLAPAGVTSRGFRQGQVVRPGAAAREVPGEAVHELLGPEAAVADGTGQQVGGAGFLLLEAGGVHAVAVKEYLVPGAELTTGYEVPSGLPRSRRPLQAGGVDLDLRPLPLLRRWRPNHRGLPPGRGRPRRGRSQLHPRIRANAVGRPRPGEQTRPPDRVRRGRPCNKKAAGRVYFFLGRPLGLSGGGVF
jgi:hypothetical protein